jgi:hypothetical protein
MSIKCTTVSEFAKKNIHNFTRSTRMRITSVQFKNAEPANSRNVFS